MAFDSVREFMEALDKSRDIVRIKEEVDWELEAGAINRRCYETQGPAVLFENIRDYPGHRILGGSLGTYRRVAIALGLDPDTPIPAIHQEYEQREQHPIKPVVVDSGPCKENVLMGEDVDLSLFPAPMIHDGDGGRYLGTWDIVVTNDPETGWTNWGMYRFMINTRRTLSGDPSPISHLALVFREKYLPKKKPMPMALVIGADPLCHMVATGGYGIDVDEADFAGALRGEPVELVKCETSDLLVPAHAEIVVEAEILPDGIAPEGPFGEYPGYRTGIARTGVLCQVKAITYRNSPILTMISLGVPVDDASVAAALTAGISMKRRLERHGIPVTAVYAPPEGVTHLVIIGVRSGGTEMARRIRDVFLARRVMVNKIIVVDEDVDVYDVGKVLHAFAVKCHPVNGIIVEEVPAGKANMLTPCYSYEERKIMKGGIDVFDCTWPVEWPRETLPIRSSFDCIYPKEIRDKVLQRWGQYGLK
ncbi:MAG: UbiD family decarboxylase [Deltaproteobacteria bacterium]|nr:MAG: UbiD family decarboxylase [Deltaproteobacteria bacterium]